MTVNTAINCFLGQGGHKRVNCAQAVLSPFQEKFGLDERVIQSFTSYGGGNAPEGLCGAFYAVKYLGKNLNAEKVENFERIFIEQAGSIKCKEIKKFKRFSCLDCVAKCAGFLAETE